MAVSWAEQLTEWGWNRSSRETGPGGATLWSASGAEQATVITKTNQPTLLTVLRPGHGFNTTGEYRLPTPIPIAQDYGMPPDEHEEAIEAELERLHIRAEAKRRFDADGGHRYIEPPLRLDELLEATYADTAYRIDQLMPTGGNIVLAAQYKAGKSTLMGNVIRSLVDGEAFLDQYQVQSAQNVMLIDDELSPVLLQRWLGEQGIENSDRVHVASLRGRVSDFDIMSQPIFEKWSRLLYDLKVDVLIIDCLRPILDALGLDENRDAGRFLVELDRLIVDSERFCEVILVHHMGHNGERSRGDSRILDWPDATWKIVREQPDNPDSPRYFSAFGRDVNVQETRLDFDTTTRRYTIRSGVTRRTAATEYAVETIAELLALPAHKDGLSGRGIENALKDTGIPRNDIRTAIHTLEKRGRTLKIPAERNSFKHILNPQCASAPERADSAPAHDAASAPPPI